MRTTSFLTTLLFAAQILYAQDANPGRVVFETRCATCHGGDGNGAEMGPPIRGRLAARNDQQLTSLIREGLPGRAMPPIQVTDAEMPVLVAFLRTLQPRNPRGEIVRAKVQTTDGKTLDGEVVNQGFEDMQLRTADQRLHLLRRVLVEGAGDEADGE